MSIHWTPTPPPAEPYLPILSPRGYPRRVEGTVLSERTVGVLVHFVDGRTTPCVSLPCENPAAETTCPWCCRQLRRRWKGYLGLQEALTGRVGLAELTEFAVRCAQLLVSDALTLRGKRLTLTRHGSRRNGHVTADLSDHLSWDDPALPPAPNVEAALLRIWYTGRTDS